MKTTEEKTSDPKKQTNATAMNYRSTPNPVTTIANDPPAMETPTKETGNSNTPRTIHAWAIIT